MINTTLLMSFDVAKSKISEFLTMRDRTKEELAALCFSACKLNLPLVPSQDDVLKDNKRCYDNILSECGITDLIQIYSSWLEEHDHGMQFGHQIFWYRVVSQRIPFAPRVVSPLFPFAALKNEIWKIPLQIFVF